MPAKRIFHHLIFNDLLLCSKNIQTSGRLCTWGNHPQVQDIYKMFQELQYTLAPMSSAESLVILGNTFNTKESANRQHLDVGKPVWQILAGCLYS